MVRRGDSGHGDQRIIFVQEDASHTNEFSSVSKKDGINPRWISIVDLLIDSGRKTMEIRSQLILRASTARDQAEAMSTLPPIEKKRNRRSHRRLSNSMTWRLKANRC